MFEDLSNPNTLKKKRLKKKEFKKKNEQIKVYRFSCMDLYIFRR